MGNVTRMLVFLSQSRQPREEPLLTGVKSVLDGQNVFGLILPRALFQCYDKL